MPLTFRRVFFVKIIETKEIVAFGEIFPVHIIHVGMASDAKTLKIFAIVICLNTITMMHLHKLPIPWIGYLQATTFTGVIVIFSIASAYLFPIFHIAKYISIHVL